jgi:hypothetical protein
LAKQFRNTNAVKRELGNVYNDLRGKKITPDLAHRLVYTLNVLLKATEQLWREEQLFDLTERMDAIERGQRI